MNSGYTQHNYIRSRRCVVQEGVREPDYNMEDEDFTLFDFRSSKILSSSSNNTHFVEIYNKNNKSVESDTFIFF